MSATDAQIRYIEILAIDLGLDRRSRNAHVSDRVGREIRGLDELTVREASDVIGWMKGMKDGGGGLDEL